MTTIHDVWFGQDADALQASETSGSLFHTGTINPESLGAYDVNPTNKYVTNITNLKPVYSVDEVARFRLFVRNKDWSPTIYTVARATADTIEIDSGSYKVVRIFDDLEVVPYGTGSDLHTVMSYDNDGNYFDFNMSMLESGHMYGVKFSYYNNSIDSWIEQPEIFKFKVE